MKIVDKLRLIGISLWLGAALFFSAVVAPSVFSVLHSFDLANANEIAGTIVTRTLAVINLGGFIIGLILLATVFILKRDAGRISLALEVLALALLAGTTAAGHWMVAARMLTLRTAMAIPIDQVAA